MEFTHVIGLVVVVAIVIGIVLISIAVVRDSRKSRAELRQWCEQRGWSFTTKDAGLSARWKQSPIRGVGGSVNIVRGSVPEGRITCFSHTVASTGSSPTTRLVGVIDVGVPLPTTVTASQTVTIAKPRPPEAVDLGQPSYGWSAFAVNREAAAEASRLLTPHVRERLEREAQAHARIELALEGTDIIVTTLGEVGVETLESWVSLLRDLARMMLGGAGPH